MIVLNKKGTAKITVKKHDGKIIPGFSPTRLLAEFINYDREEKKISPIWIVECKHHKDYVFEETEDGMCLSISTGYDHTGDIIKVTLVDREGNYVKDSIELGVQSVI